MGLRDRMQDRREERRDDGNVHFQMRQKLASIGDDYWIQDQAGNRVYKVNGKALRIRETLIFEDAQGNELAKIQERKLRVRDTMNIEDADGNTMATVKKAVISPIRDRWKVSMGDGPDIDVKGNILDHEYTLEMDGRKVGEVSKRWVRLADTYGVGVELWSATSYKALREDALSAERWNRLHPSQPARTPIVTELLGGSDDPIVAVTDFMKIVPEQIARFAGGRRFVPLGTDGMGRSDTREALRDHFEVDAGHVVVAVLSALLADGKASVEEVEGAIARHDIDPDQVDPLTA